MRIQTGAEYTSDNAIARSVSHGEIVTVEDEPGLQDALLCACDDHVSANDVHEFWGTTDDGDEWRVHVTLA